ncbi:MAG: hypothetical protein H0U49_02630 [Parachlamydiaceae bacterium]|nr:hypothetical protein [Parachlamydiaceae bacterium]
MAGHEDKVEKIEKLSSTEKTSAPFEVDSEENRIAPNKEQFETLMGQKPIEPETTAGRKVESTKVSLVDQVADLSRRAGQVGRSPPELLVAQAQEVITKIDELKEKLSTPNLEIKGSVQNLLTNKLSHIDESLKVALSKAGVEYDVAPSVSRQSSNPIERFLGFLQDSQSRLNTLSSDVSTMAATKGEFTPALMLSMQVKVGFVQQELEFFTALLNKALESTKTIMNVQV